MRMTFLSSCAGILLAAAIGLPSAVSADTASLDELRAKKGPDEKIEKLKQTVKELKDELKIVRANLIQYDTFFASEVDETAQDGGELMVGTGNQPTNFVIQLDDDIEVGLKFHYRQGADIPVSYIDTQGVIHVFVPSGPQVVDAEHGVPVANAARAAWNVAFSVNTAYGDTPVTLADLDAKLRFDLDPGSGSNFLNLDLEQLNATPPEGISGYGWVDNADVAVIDDDGGTPEVTQNSFNYEFIKTRLTQDYTGYPPAEFDVQLVVKGHAEIKVKVHVVPAAS